MLEKNTCGGEGKEHKQAGEGFGNSLMERLSFVIRISVSFFAQSKTKLGCQAETSNADKLYVRIKKKMTKLQTLPRSKRNCRNTC